MFAIQKSTDRLFSGCVDYSQKILDQKDGVSPSYEWLA